MNKRILVDTNILIYALDRDSKFHTQAHLLFNRHDIEIFTTSKNITEFLVVLTRDEDLNISIKECIESLEGMLADVTVLYPNKTSFELFYDLVRKYNAKGLWIHDVEIASIALAHGIKDIATKNIKDFKRLKEINILEF